MSHLAVQIDMDRMQAEVQHAIRPAVESALAKKDIKAAIEEVLNRPSQSRSEGSFYHRMVMYGEPDTASLIDSLVQQSINSLAKEYVEHNVRDMREVIEEGFRKMMRGSTDRLVNSFVGAIERGLEDDWGFELDVKVSHTVHETEHDYD